MITLTRKLSRIESAASGYLLISGILFSREVLSAQASRFGQSVVAWHDRDQKTRDRLLPDPVKMLMDGAFLKLHPGTNGWLSAVLWWVANAGMVVMVVGLYITYSGELETGDPIAAVGGVLTFIAMAVFAYIVFRARD